MGLHPMATLISMIAGLKLCGFVGLIGFPVALSLLVNAVNGMEEAVK
ncbi:MAG: hypothetical protein SOY85_22190 [Blautia sp.]|jgi:predicted PurR-regulated permease PerM|nr:MULTISPECIES: hypothetical protein [Blautia]MCI5966369.1 hypothetical protein [Clostridia bacterium]MCQ4736784.1 hypothetical protein [Blautia hominis]MCQ5093927.1 hypothetical protein [Blautia producta]MDY4057572.1 hypothetical protein [Blautia sp.]